MKDDGVRLGIVSFGKKLLKTGDLDPLYIALHHSGMSRSQLNRWIIAYWCFYHAGLCCQLATRKDFFDSLIEVAKGGTKYPRGTERRHFRGDLAIESTTRLRERFGTSKNFMDFLLEGEPTAVEMMARVKTLYGFGEWICWKVPDMIERLGIAPVEFTDQDASKMFKSSKQGAKETGWGDIQTAHLRLQKNLCQYKAPPLYDRFVNVQETETVFCKWHSHRGGHYPVGKDTEEIGEGLRKSGKGNLTRKLLMGLSKSPLGAL